MIVKSCRDHREISEEVISEHEFQPIDTSFKENIIIKRPSMKMMELIEMPPLPNDLSDGELMVTARDLSLGEIIVSTDPVRHQSLTVSASNTELKSDDHVNHVEGRRMIDRTFHWMRKKMGRLNCFRSTTN